MPLFVSSAPNVVAKNTKCLPSGRNNGQRCEEKLVELKNRLVCGASPLPSGLIRCSTPPASPEKRITLPVLHVPPRGATAVASICGETAGGGKFFFFPSAE